MVQRFFYMYPLKKILQIFPKLRNPNQCGSFEETNVANGWVPEMAKFANMIHPIEKEESCGAIIRIKNSVWNFDVRLGEILIVDSFRTDNCYYLTLENDTYKITRYKKPGTIGGIINKEPPPPIKKIMTIRSILHKKMQ